LAGIKAITIKSIQMNLNARSILNRFLLNNSVLPVSKFIPRIRIDVFNQQRSNAFFIPTQIELAEVAYSKL
jgi:hypothetical protein